MVTQTNSRLEGDVHIFQISGRLALGNTLLTIERSLERLIEQGVKKLVVDVTSLSTIDSAGLGTLLMIAGKIEQAGGAMKIAGASGVIERTFEIVHLRKVIDQHADVNSAVSAFASQSAGAA